MRTISRRTTWFRPETPRLTALAVVGALLALAPGRNAHAQTSPEDPLQPDLVEIEAFYPHRTLTLESDTVRQLEPAWVSRERPDLSAMEWQSPLRAVPGESFYDLEETPRHGVWWRYPLYAVVGTPRDLADGFFGLVGYVPIFNLPFTGAGYEMLPTQVLMRHPKHWHRWPGRANKNGEAWLGGERWGFFSNWRETRASIVDQDELERRKRHNEDLREALKRANREIENHNAEALRLRAVFLDEVREDYRQGRYRAVIRKLTPYLAVDRRNREAKAMLATAVVVEMPSVAERDWADAVLSNLMFTSSTDDLIGLKEELGSHRDLHAANAGLPFYLVWVNYRLKAYGQAFEEATRLTEMDPGNTAWARLRFETALAAGEPSWIDRAMEALETQAGEGALATLHARGRLAFARNEPLQARMVYEHLARLRPENSQYQYLFAVALIEQAREGEPFARETALEALGRAVENAPTVGEQNAYRKALRAAREFEPGRG